MLKKIRTSQLCLGMFITEFCGSWTEHPFWFNRTSFILNDPQDLQRIKTSKILEVWIDSERGADVSEGAHFTSEEQATQQIDMALNVELKANPRQHAPIEDEYARAARLCEDSRQAVTAMFNEARMGNAINGSEVSDLVNEISQSVMRNPSALISLARLKTADDYTYMHSVAVSALMISLGRHLAMDGEVLHRIGVAGLLHDLGKIMIPLEVLNKPGRLSDEEFNLVKSHPAEGYWMLAKSNGFSDIALDVVLHHHEKMDGSGYPKGLKGDQLSIYARMGAICDVYDAVTSTRAYKAAWDPAEALHKMAEWTGPHFDMPVFQAFVKSVGIYPVGSLVRLGSQHLGVVVEQSPVSLLKPRVCVIYSIRDNCKIEPTVIDLATTNCTEHILGREEPAKWDLGNLDKFWLH